MFNERYGKMPEKAIIIVASPQAPKGMLWDLDMNTCVGMFRRFRADPEGFQSAIPNRTKG
jgi:hypothetical protein